MLLSRWDVEIARTLIHKICYRLLVPIHRTFEGHLFQIYRAAAASKLSLLLTHN